MSNSPHISKPSSTKGRLSKITRDNLSDYIESIEKLREEREAQLKQELFNYIESVEKLREEWEGQLEQELHIIVAEHKLKLSIIFDNSYKYLENKIISLETQIQGMKDKM